MRFQYLKDPLFVFCLILYFVNRWVLKPYFPNGFSHSRLNDVICIPFWVPIMVFILRKAGWRYEDTPPSGSEILIPLIVWSWGFEIFLPSVPFFKGLATADYADVMSYTIGALLAAIFWKIWYGRKSLKR